MKIYKISQTENKEYDTWDGAIVYAPNPEVARNLSPSDGKELTQEDWSVIGSTYNWKWRGGWVNSPEKVNVEYLGEAEAGMEQGLILDSFNAG